MEYTKENLQELAESIYDLDAEVYAQLGSSLGRVFNRDREGCVSDMVQLMLRKDSHQLRSELALISNMARTIEDKGTRSMIMTEYNRILKEVIALPTSLKHVSEKIITGSSASAVHTAAAAMRSVLCWRIN